MISLLHTFMSRLSLGKQIAVAIAVMILGPILLGCLYIGAIFLLSSIPVEYAYLHPADQIQHIEIIYITVSDDTAQFQDAHVCVTISEEHQAAFLSDMYELTWYNYGNDPPFPVGGACIRITYQNGDIEILSSVGTYYATDTETNFTSRHLDDEELIPMLIAYGYQEPDEEALKTPDKPNKPTLPPT